MIHIADNGLWLDIDVTAEGDVRLLHFGPTALNAESLGAESKRKWYRLVELQATGHDIDDHHGAKHTGTVPGGRLKYKAHREYRADLGRKLEIEQTGEELVVISHMQFFDGVPVVRAWTEVKNVGTEPVGLEYVSSFALTGLDKEGSGTWDDKSLLHVCHNSWCGEFQWRSYRLPDLGLSRVAGFTLKRVSFANTGTWTAKEFLPVGGYENTASGTVLFWQIETSGSWQWEIGDLTVGRLYLRLSGPTENENHWWKNLRPGETFISEPAAVGTVAGNPDRAFQELTRYRRRIIRPNADHKNLPVIFNDYMHCLWADPTTEKERPLIAAAAEAGCEVYCVDAGWYGEGGWWDSVGEWQPTEKRFPGGLTALLGEIRAKGMVPGLWLELEVMGVNCPLARQWPDKCFFMRHGKRVIDHGRYQLDFRHPRVRSHADAVVDRLVRDYGVGYIKMDYNIDAGPGTEVAADSFGDGLLGHTRAYLDWLTGVFDRYPNLVIENCSSGGLRVNYALLAQHSIQSTSDQIDYRKTAAIAANAPAAAVPEQAAVWSYPVAASSREEVIFNMVNALLLRIHQSGRIDQLPPEHLAVVKEAIAFYKTIRRQIPQGLPFWPLGLGRFDSEWLALGLQTPAATYLAVWRQDTEKETCVLPNHHLKERPVAVRLAFPAAAADEAEWDAESGTLTVALPQKFSARIFELTAGTH